MIFFRSLSRLHPRDRYALREAVLASFALPREAVAVALGGFSEAEWQCQLLWLDVSGLALYLFDRLTAYGQQDLLPPSVLARLEQNLVDNRARSAALLAEAVQINRDFASEGIVYANLKGVTLTPESVADASLRCQLDLDFMVRADHAPAAACVLERMGYELDCVSGKTWEFKAGMAELASLKDLYKVKPQRCAELHLAPGAGLLERVEVRLLAGTAFPVLSPVDLYVAQAQHLFKHVCSPCARASWLLEARRHMLVRREDESFWLRLEQRVVSEPEAITALGVVTLLIVEVFGDTPPERLSRLIAGHISQPVRLWVTRYGRRALLDNFPGTKFYLLLLAELPEQAAVKRSVRRRHLLPLRQPAMITRGYAGEGFGSRMRRYRIQLGFIAFRLRFHAVEGARYVVEASRFRRLLTGVAQ